MIFFSIDVLYFVLSAKGRKYFEAFRKNAFIPKK